jgi:hypothetical protein
VGTPEQVARNSQSHTGKFLARALNNNHNGQNHANHSASESAPTTPAAPNVTPRNSLAGK